VFVPSPDSTIAAPTGARGRQRTRYSDGAQERAVVHSMPPPRPDRRCTRRRLEASFTNFPGFERSLSESRDRSSVRPTAPLDDETVELHGTR
jgi:hypothetical protein